MRLESVGFRYARRRARVLDGVTLDLDPGTVTAVIGANGSGKSTLLKVAAGLVRPTSGTVRGRPDRIGYVPERLPADMRLSARSYLLHMGRIQGIGTATASRRSRELLDQLGVEGDLDAPISTLSKGNAQKVALAQAMLVGPQLLVLDEPWSGLDARTHRVLMDCLANRRAAGVIVLLTEHRPGAVAASADAVYRLHRGQLAEQLVDQTPPEPKTFAIDLGMAPAATVGLRQQVGTLSALPGVVAAREEGGRVRLKVVAERSDTVLAEALKQGYSVHKVCPTWTDSPLEGVADLPAEPEGGSR
ncbi:ABC transporter ATP-binding protein [Streptomyces sp. AcE210]|uniref:ABC transporter ATP-binding protein n=1 Tax=Streptomyces sp. AcE210 TaxID=2292703 RepID=UPI0019CF8B64|nr:ABC transporter ATP-binding protein [Streptomyces sp. AcE210]